MGAENDLHFEQQSQETVVEKDLPVVNREERLAVVTPINSTVKESFPGQHAMIEAARTEIANIPQSTPNRPFKIIKSVN